MKTGDIVLIPFPFAELTSTKVRPAAVISKTKDKYEDVIISAISSVIPRELTKNEIYLKSSKVNGLKVNSVLKTDRIVTLKSESVLVKLGQLSKDDLMKFKEIFKNLIDD